MNIADIENFLKFRRFARLEDFVRHFRSEQGLVRDRLEQYVLEGKLAKQLVSNCCGEDCDVCDTSFSEMYRLVDI